MVASASALYGRSSRCRWGSRAGSTIVESAIALAVVVLALVGFSRAVISSVVTAEQQAEASLALEAARAVIETLQAATFEDVYALYNANQDDDPAGAPGPSFAVEGLRPLDDDADGLVGEILFPTAGTGGGLELREDVDDASLGMPRDLDGDGAIDSNDHSTDYALLPVLVRVRWRSSSGPARMELRTLLADF